MSATSAYGWLAWLPPAYIVRYCCGLSAGKAALLIATVGRWPLRSHDVPLGTPAWADSKRFEAGPRIMMTPRRAL